MSLRNRELLNLVAVGLLTAIGFASVYIARSEPSEIDAGSLTYAGIFMSLYLAAHLVVRYAVPYADAVLLPLTALLSAIGVTLIYRLEPDDAFRQSLWIVIGVILFAVVLIALRRDFRILEQYKYLFGVTSILLLMLPALPGIGQTINGARLWVKVGAFQFQPGELAKIFLIVFLAGYLRDKREVLAQGRLKDFGPLLLIWGAAMLVLVQTNDLGSGLLLFGIFLAMLYVATGRAAYAAAGLALFVAGAAFVYHYVSHVQERVTIWLAPWTDQPVFCAQTGELALRQDCGSFQLVKSLYSIGNGGFAGTGLGKGIVTTTTGQPIVPYLNTDFIYSAIAQELGLVGSAGLLLVFMLFVARGFRVALLADDGFSKLLAAGTRGRRADRRSRRRQHLLAGVGRGRSCRPPGQPDPARRRVHDQARRDSRPRDHVRQEPAGEERRAHLLLPRVPDPRARRPRPRLLDPVALSDGARALDERLPDGSERQPLDRARHLRRQGEGSHDRGERPVPHPRPAGAARGPGSSRQPLRRRHRARARDRAGADDVLLPHLRPESRRDRFRPRDGRARRLQAAGRAPQPRHRWPLRTRLDLQGRNGLRGDRLRPLRGRLQLRRPGLLRGLREARQQLRHLAPVRQARAAHGARQLGQLGVLQHRQGARREVPRRLHETLRLLRDPAARDAVERARAQRALQGHRAVRPEAGHGRRPRPDGVRPGTAAGDAAPDGDGGGNDRQRRRRDGTTRRGSDRGPRRLRRLEDASQRARPRREDGNG